MGKRDTNDGRNLPGSDTVRQDRQRIRQAQEPIAPDSPVQTKEARRDKALLQDGKLQPNPSLNRGTRIGRPTEDEQLLRRPELKEPAVVSFTHTDPWRVLRITGEFVQGFDTLSALGPAVTIFGSARVNPDDPDYQAAQELAERLAHAGFAIITGGGPGIMEAANKGAQLGGGDSVGCNIELPHEQGTNAYVEIGINFRYFFVRKTMFMKYSEAFVIFPGGFGTMDELFEALTLIQTGKVRNFPVLLYNKAYWQGLLDWIGSTMLKAGKVDAEDFRLLRVTDDLDEICSVVVDCYNNSCWDLPGNEAEEDIGQ